MSGRSYFRRALGLRRQISSLHRRSEPPVQHDTSSDPLPYFEPTPSQILRYGLKGSTQSLRKIGHSGELDQHFEELFSDKWPLKTAPPSPLWSSLERTAVGPSKKAFTKSFDDIQDLQQLHLFLEKYVNEEQGCLLLQHDDSKSLARVLERCQQYNTYGEILSTISAITTRIEGLQAHITHSLFKLGMHYACLAFSAPALRRYIDGYLAAGPQRLGPRSSASLINTLLYSLQSLQMQRTHHDFREMLQAVAGETHSGGLSPHCLHKITCWADRRNFKVPLERYLSLLARLRSNSLLQTLWDETIERLTPDSPSHRYQSAYDCVKTLFDVGSHERALTYLGQISECANNNLPGLSKFKDLRGLLVNEIVLEVLPSLAGTEYPSILEVQVQDMERSLGIVWNPNRNAHVSASDPLQISSGQPLLTIDGDSFGYDSNARLVADVQALGCSQSKANLEKIVSLLDEYEGAQISVGLRRQEVAHLDFAWLPHRSPVELVNTSKVDSSNPSLSCNLGLLRLQPDSNGITSAIEHSLYLLQLGYVVARPKSLDGVTEEPIDWEETGYIVAWDRAIGRMILVFIGQSRGVLDSGLQKLDTPPFGLPLVMEVVVSKGKLKRSRTSSFPWIRATRVHLEVDQGLDLAT
ncbi:hypothetical protein BDV25DRAFT_157130 [Aspergillus avenaceus]|uniref:Uncharacterized protein n=1 Tax=Aspergillus avenaceus TaxID=36643 RepID=A0A5N6TRN1_ASPAV|nr:hypothetical protein BDV25DRAFT_157130 [Aspergillus avenaceus]